MSNVKKGRNPNFKKEEYNLLLTLVNNCKDIVENKKPDAVTGREKDKAWDDIAHKFNAQCGGCFRSGETLRKFYSNKKTGIRKRAAQNFQERRKTGGGPPVNILTETDELLLSIINTKTIEGLSGENFDSDAIFDNSNSTSNEIEILPDIYVVNEDNFLQRQQVDYSPHSAQEKAKVDNSPHSAQEKANESIKESEINWQKYKPKDLKKSPHPHLKALATPSGSKDWTSRRRPLINSLPTSELTKKYEMLADMKLEATSLYLEEMKEKRHLTAEILKVELEMKKQQLKKLIEAD